MTMDRSRADRNRTHRGGNYGNVAEHEYHVVDDQEEVLGVCIFPAKPINDHREYAAPPVDRDRKPGRWMSRLDKNPPASPEKQISQHQQRWQLPPPPPPRSPPTTSTCEPLSCLPAGDPRTNCRRDKQQRNNKKTGLKSHCRGSHSAERGLTHSFDLECHNAESRSTGSLEKAPSKHCCHEWPQTKEDWEQHDFVPKERPQQTSCEEDWYVGACSRADAEHALHLVNRDGAFLVRDCSINTDSQPLVLAMYHDKKVYNVKIRFIEGTNMYALGTGQRSNDMFHSVADIIKFHSIFPIILVSGRNLPPSKHPDNCVLTCPVTRTDIEQLLL